MLKFTENDMDIETSGNVAKERLKFILSKDRYKCSSETLLAVKNDIIKVISNYMDIDAKNVTLYLTSNNDTTEINATIGIKNTVKRK